MWAPLLNQNIQIIRSIYTIKDIMEQLHLIISKITKNFSQQYDCAMNYTRKISCFLACQKICQTYINELKRKNTQNGQIIHHKVYYFKWRTYSFDTSNLRYLSFFMWRGILTFRLENLFDVHVLILGKRYNEFGKKGNKLLG